MRWTVAAALLALLVVETPRADACGVKLTVKGQGARKAVARSSNPSDVLLVGNPPRRLERDLEAAGHRVDVASNPSAAKRKTYRVVIVESNQQDNARSAFKDSVVLVRSGDVAADLRTVENQIARRPVRTDETRPVVAARAARQPIAAKPAQAGGQVVAAREQGAEPPAASPPTPPPQPERVAVTAPKSVEPAPTPAPARPAAKAAEPKTVVAAAPPDERAPKQKATTPRGLQGEVYFRVGSAEPGDRGKLDKAVQWLTANASVQVAIEGHADPSGSPEANMTLSQQRAEAVRDYLVGAGIDGTRLEVTPFGDTKLKYSRSDTRNRRVVLVPKPASE